MQTEMMQDNNRMDKLPLAMAYVPWQEFRYLYEDLEKAYRAGTVFMELDKPFEGRRFDG